MPEKELHNYWAKFESIDKDTFRFDTRIYLNPIHEPTIEDSCIGAIVGKNPGSAKPEKSCSEIQPITLAGDKLLPTVRNILLKSYILSGVQIPEKGYIQVLNLFYLCNPNLTQAIETITTKKKNIQNCATETLTFPWVWYVWGQESKLLTELKLRFKDIRTDKPFYYDKLNALVVNHQPTLNSFAKHTQGLKHSLIIPYISELIKNS